MSEIKITLEDKTEDRRFSNVNTANDVVENATKAKTEQNSAAGSTPGVGGKVAKAVGNQLANDITRGGVGQMSGLLSAATDPVAIALLALTTVKQFYSMLRDKNLLYEESEMTRLRAGGSNRGAVNMMNQRSFIPNRSFGGTTTYVRR